MHPPELNNNQKSTVMIRVPVVCKHPKRYKTMYNSVNTTHIWIFGDAPTVTVASLFDHRTVYMWSLSNQHATIGIMQAFRWMRKSVIVSEGCLLSRHQITKSIREVLLLLGLLSTPTSIRIWTIYTKIHPTYWIPDNFCFFFKKKYQITSTRVSQALISVYFVSPSNRALSK